MSDEEIINRTKNKEYGKLAKHLYRYFPVIQKFILKNSGTKEEAEDVFQDALIIFFNKVNNGAFKLESTLNTYLFGISKNLWHVQLRKRKNEIVSDLYTVNSASIENDINSAIEENLKFQKALEAVSSLGDRCKSLLLMFYYKKMSMAEIAKKTGVSSEKLVKNQKYRCIEKAKEIYSSLN